MGDAQSGGMGPQGPHNIEYSQAIPPVSILRIGLSLQIKWQYLQINVLGLGSVIVTIEDSIREAFLYALFGGEEFSANFREILGHSVKCGSLGIPDPRLSAERVQNAYKAASEVLVGSLLVGTDLNYVVYKGCVCRASADGRK